MGDAARAATAKAITSKRLWSSVVGAGSSRAIERLKLICGVQPQSRSQLALVVESSGSCPGLAES